MTRFHVEVTELDATVNLLNQFNAWCENLLSTMDATAAGLAETWSGEAATRFAELHEEWVAGAAEMGAGLVAMKSASSDSGANYQAAADANKAVWA